MTPDDDKELLRSLRRIMHANERYERRLKAVEARRERKGVYERYRRRMVALAMRATTEALIQLAAKQATDLKRAKNAARFREARHEATVAWLIYEDAQGFSEEAVKFRELKRLPVEHGKSAAKFRWSNNWEIREVALKRWHEGEWPSKAAFARAVKDEIQAEAVKRGGRFSAENLERTIRSWLPKK